MNNNDFDLFISKSVDWRDIIIFHCGFCVLGAIEIICCFLRSSILNSYTLSAKKSIRKKRNYAKFGNSDKKGVETTADTPSDL